MRRKDNLPSIVRIMRNLKSRTNFNEKVSTLSTHPCVPWEKPDTCPVVNLSVSSEKFELNVRPFLAGEVT